jgi:hypothetical protein
MPKKSAKLTAEKIPDDTWRALYEAADALGELQLWQLMGDAELLGVDDPHTGEPVLGAVMGRLGEVFGIAIHHGPAGLRWILELATSDEPELDMDAFLAVAVLKVEFVKKAELPAEDKRRVKALGFTPRGGMRARWPLFESKRPDHMPGPIHAEDARLLLHALPRLTALGAAVMPILEKDDPVPADGFAFWPAGKTPDEPLRTEDIEWRHVTMPSEPAPAIFSADEKAIAQLAALPKHPGLVIELDAFAGTATIAADTGLQTMKAALAAESRSGSIVGLELGVTPADTLENIAGRALMAGIKALGICPGTVQVTKRNLLSALAPFAAKLGIRIVHCHELPAIEEARAAMPPHFRLSR